MNLKKGEIWVCKQPYCQVEIEVLRTAESTCHGKFALRCCCGKDMLLKKSDEAAERDPASPGERPRRHM